MPRPLPSTWTKQALQHSDLVLVVEVFRDKELDGYWGDVGDVGTYGRERVSFWSQDNVTLRTAQTGYNTWIYTDRLLSFGRVEHRRNARDLGGLGGTSTFQFSLNNRPSSQLGGFWPDFLTQHENERDNALLENRPARVFLMAKDATSYITEIVPIMAGRLTMLEPDSKHSVRCTIEDPRLQSDIEVPTKVWSEGELLNDILVVQSAWGQPKPWLFGNVPYAGGRRVVDSYKTATDLRGPLVNFVDASEVWQTVYDMQELYYGSELLVDSSEPPGICYINTASGGWAGGPRSPHTKLGDNTGYYFDNHNSAHLYLKLDVLFRLQDDVRTTLYSGATDPENLIDRDPDSVATMPAVTVGGTVPNAEAGATLSFPNCNGFQMRIEGTTSNNWEQQGGGGATNDYGVYVFWEGDDNGKVTGTDSWLGIWPALYGGTSYQSDASEGPAYFFRPGGSFDNYDPANRENYRMSQRANSTAGLGGTPDMNLSSYEVRQGAGRYFVVGVFAEQTGSGGIASGVEFARVGMRFLGRVDFPDTGFVADVQGYEVPVGNNYTGAVGTLCERPGDVLLLIMREALGIAYPHTYWSLFTQLHPSDIKVARQVTERTQASDLIDELLADVHSILWGGDDLNSEQITGGTLQGVLQIPLTKVNEPSYTFNDDMGPTDSGVMVGTVRMERTPVQDVYTRFEYRWGFSSILDDYAHTAVFSETESELGPLADTAYAATYLTTTLQAELGASASRYARPSDKYTLVVDAPWVQTASTAAYMLAFLIRNKSKRRRIVKLTTSLVPIGVRFGDIVQCNLRDLPDSWNVQDGPPGANGPVYVVFDNIISKDTGKLEFVLVEISPLERLGYIIPA